jgi:hypothetical protein
MPAAVRRAAIAYFEAVRQKVEASDLIISADVLGQDPVEPVGRLQRYG